MSDGRVIPVKVTDPLGPSGAVATEVVTPIDINDSTPIDVNITGGAPLSGDVVSTDHIFAVSNGDVPGQSVFSIYGYNDAIDTGTVPEHIKSNGGLFDWPVAAEPLEIVSTSADDSAAGIGGRLVMLRGLDANFDEVTEMVATAGLGVATSVNSYVRLNDARVLSVGTYHGSNLGTITITQQTSGDEMAIIPAGDGVKNGFRYTIPNGKTAHLLQTTVAISRGSGSISNGASYKFRSYINADDVTGPAYGSRNTQVVVDGIRGQIQYDTVYTSVIPSKTDIWVEVFKVSQNNTAVSCSGLLLLIDD